MDTLNDSTIIKLEDIQQVLMQCHDEDDNTILCSVKNLPKDRVDEDRSFACNDHKVQYFTRVSSYGIYDGHNGAFAADYCSKNLNNRIIERYNKLLDDSVNSVSDTKEYTYLTKEDKEDALLVQAMYSVFDEIHTYIVGKSDAGTTVVSIFIIQDNKERVNRIYTCSVGDSRAVIFNRTEVKKKGSIVGQSSNNDLMVSSAHSNRGNSSNHHNGRYDFINVFDDGFGNSSHGLNNSVHSVASSFNNSIHSVASANSDSNRKVPISVTTTGTAVGSTPTASVIPSLKSSTAGNTIISVISSDKAQNIAVANILNEDHSLSLSRERYRIENKLPASHHLLPASVSIIIEPMMLYGIALQYQRNEAVDANSDSNHVFTSLIKADEKDMLYTGYDEKQSFPSLLKYPSSNKLIECGRYLDNFKLKKIPKRRASTTSLDFVLQFSESFICQRTAITSTGVVLGNDAVKSRYNVSLMMTRSLGDKLGPRSCVPIPEITKFEVPFGIHARIVMASDGLWDVVGIEQVKGVVFNPKFHDGAYFGTYLADKAHRRRCREGMRMDDITVLVIDLSMPNFVPIKGNKGGMKGSMRMHHSSDDDKATAPILIDDSSIGCSCMIA